MSAPLPQSDQNHNGHGPLDLTGRVLGAFRLLRRLGRGAMAEVYLAEQAGLGRRVALKILKPELAGDRVYLKRFQREAQAAASLVHANIVQIYEVGQIEGLHYIAQEYVEGQNLGQWVARQGPPDFAHALSVMRQTAAALAKAAEQGIVHRDIKPENIMLTPTGEVKVADFGLARFAREGDAVDLTQVGMTMGTPLYMSPEQVEGRPLDPRSDLYSLGVTCYQMLSGAPPFTGETALAVAVQHIKSEPRPLEQLRPDLPLALCRIVQTMMAKQADQRYASAHELLKQLRQLQKEHFGDQWPEDSTDWDVPGVPLPPPQDAVTRQLDAVLKTLQIESLPRARRWWLIVAAALTVMFILGGMTARLTVAQQRPLLVDSSDEPVERQDNVVRQWYVASLRGTEEGWQSVIRYFPKNEYMVHRAQQQLARLYLREGQNAKAMEIFEAFANLGKGEEDLQAFGLTGQYAILTRQERHAEAAAVLERLSPIRNRLRDGQMQQLLSSAIRKNHQRMGEQSSREWQQWLEQQFGENN